jgi:N-acetylneuraminate synthase
MDKLKKIKSQNVYVIAEIGMNHNGSFPLAVRLIKAAQKAGAAAVKFQMHISEEETLKNAPRPPFFKNEDRYKFFQRTAFSLNQWRNLKKTAKSLKLDFIVSPFSIKAAKILKAIGLDAYKIASGEVNNLPLLEYINTTKLPVILSTGMSSWPEINRAVTTLKHLKVIMQCSSKYPLPAEAVGLNIIGEMAKKYKKPVIGFSDHTLSNASSIAALVMGARVFEKHFTLSKKAYGPDARFSLEPAELRSYIDGLKFVSAALAKPIDKNALKPYGIMKQVFEKSIVASRPLPPGAVLKMTDLAFKKPGDGLKADQYKKLIGKKLTKNLIKDQKITYDHFR